LSSSASLSETDIFIARDDEDDEDDDDDEDVSFD